LGVASGKVAVVPIASKTPGSKRNESSPRFEFQAIDAVTVYDVAL
jgi:hypothetical protein